MGMEKRLLLAFALMMIVLLGAQYFFKPAPGPKPHSNITPQKAAQLSEKPVSPPPASAAPAASPVTPLSTKAAQAPAETTQVIDTDLYHIVFSNKGAVIKSWVLKKFLDNSGKPLDLVNVAASGIPYPFSIDTKGRHLSVDPNQVLYITKAAPDHLGVSFSYSDGKTSIQKTFHFTKNSYVSDISSEVLENGAPVSHVLSWRGGS